jgi:hypothetical protein
MSTKCLPHICLCSPGESCSREAVCSILTEQLPGARPQLTENTKEIKNLKNLIVKSGLESNGINKYCQYTVLRAVSVSIGAGEVQWTGGQGRLPGRGDIRAELLKQRKTLCTFT